MSSSAKADAERDMRREREEKHRLACRASTNELRKVLATAGNELDRLEEAWAGTPASRKYVSDLEHELHELKSTAKEARKKAAAELKEWMRRANELGAEVDTLKARERDYMAKAAHLEQRNHDLVAQLASGVRVITKRVEVPAKPVHPPPSESLAEERRMKLAWMRRALELGSDPEIAQAWRSQGRLGSEIEDPTTQSLLRQATFRVLHQGGWPHKPDDCPLCPKATLPSDPNFFTEAEAAAIHTT